VRAEEESRHANCTRSAWAPRLAGRPSEVMPSIDSPDARDRRLRAALAAVLVPDNTPELRVVHEWLDLS
jgi:hypothetical protein